MEQVVRVQTVSDDGTARVVRLRGSACSSDCHTCAGCGAKTQTILLTARNHIGAKPGDWVVIQSGSGPVLLGALVVYVLPVVLFFLGYLLGSLAGGMGALTGGAAFVLGITGAILYDRLVIAKRKTVYTITGYPAAGSWEKEEDSID